MKNRGGFDAGMKRDIVPLHPMAITVNFTWNDAVSGDAGYEPYITAATKLVQQLKSSGARVALLAPSPNEDYAANQPAGSPYNRMLWKYALGLKKIAEQENVRFVDSHTPFVTAIETGRQAGVLSPNEAGGKRLTADGAHLNWAGSLVFATAILKGLGASAIVSRAEIDAGAGKVLAAEGCKIEMLPPAGGALAFRRTDEYVPWFIPVDGRLALQVPGVRALEDLSRYELRVTNLTAPQYKLTIDDVPAGTFPKAQLAEGVNLSLQAGPITAQAEKLFNTVVSKNTLYTKRWSAAIISADSPDWQGPEGEAARQKEFGPRDAEIARQEQTINELRQPVPHVFKLVPVE